MTEPTEEQIEDILECGNPTDEEKRLIWMGWDAACKQNEALIRQLVEALEDCKDSIQERIDALAASGMDKHKPIYFRAYVLDLQHANEALAAGRARLEDKS